MHVVRATEQVGPPAEDAGWYFTGNVWSYLTMPPTDGIVINSVCFAPGARTFWHTHEVGQILLILAGQGRVGSATAPAQVVGAGDTIWTPAGEPHWHGAAPGAYMTHLAISIGSTDWDGEVADADYGAAR